MSKKIYHCLIVEDETYAANLIADYLKRFDFFYAPQIAHTIADAEKKIKKRAFDALFCDIHLPDGNTIDFINSLTEQIPVILITADSDQSLIAYEMDVIDYIVKPIRQERFNKAIDKLLQAIHGRKQILKQQQSGKTGIDSYTLENILISRYQLSRTESAICCSIADGKTTTEILEIHEITRNTWKTHLKRIFSKTIDLDNNVTQKSQGKLQYLTWFLMNLKDEN